MCDATFYIVKGFPIIVWMGEDREEHTVPSGTFVYCAAGEIHGLYNPSETEDAELVSWESLAAHHADEVIRENPVDDKPEKKGRGRGGGGPVSRTDPDARLARKSARARFEPSYKHHAVVDDERGVVLDVSVTEGTRNEREMMASHIEAVSELSGRAPEMVTADSGYAYSKCTAHWSGGASVG